MSSEFAHLAAEVDANLPIRLVVKAAAAAWSGDRSIYSDLPTESISRKSGGGHGGHHGGRRRRTTTQTSETHANGGGALEEAKKVVEDALKKSKSGGGKSSFRGHQRNRRSTSGDADFAAVRKQVEILEEKFEEIQTQIDDLRLLIKLGKTGENSAASPPPTKSAEPKAAEAKNEDFDLFGSSDEEEENAEAQRVKAERLRAYAEKKSKKPALIAKSSVILDVKPWDDETDLKLMEQKVKSIEMEGLNWGASKMIPIGYGIQKLQVVMTIEDEKVSVDDLIEKICDDFGDFVQSADIVAFNKI